MASASYSEHDWYLKNVPHRLGASSGSGRLTDARPTFWAGLLGPIIEQRGSLVANVQGANDMGNFLRHAISMMTAIESRQVLRDRKAMMIAAANLWDLVPELEARDRFAIAARLDRGFLESGPSVPTKSPKEALPDQTQNALLAVALGIEDPISDEADYAELVDRWRKRKTPRAMGLGVICRLNEVFLKFGPSLQLSSELHSFVEKGRDEIRIASPPFHPAQESALRLSKSKSGFGLFLRSCSRHFPGRKKILCEAHALLGTDGANGGSRIIPRARRLAGYLRGFFAGTFK